MHANTSDARTHTLQVNEGVEHGLVSRAAVDSMDHDHDGTVDFMEIALAERIADEN